MLYKMINVYDCDEDKPTKKEIKMLLKSLKPRQKLPLLNDWLSPEGYHDQIICENYLDRLLEGYTLKFVTNRYINESGGITYLIESGRLHFIILGIYYAIKRRGLDLHFEWKYREGVLLHNNKPNFHRGCGHDYESEGHCSSTCKIFLILGNIESDKCIEIRFKINGTKIECYDYSSEEW